MEYKIDYDLAKELSVICQRNLPDMLLLFIHTSVCDTSTQRRPIIRM